MNSKNRNKMYTPSYMETCRVDHYTDPTKPKPNWNHPHFSWSDSKHRRIWRRERRLETKLYFERCKDKGQIENGTYKNKGYPLCWCQSQDYNKECLCPSLLRSKKKTSKGFIQKIRDTYSEG